MVARNELILVLRNSAKMIMHYYFSAIMILVMHYYFSAVMIMVMH